MTLVNSAAQEEEEEEAFVMGQGLVDKLGCSLAINFINRTSAVELKYSLGSRAKV
jgi:hypothetical protein